MGIVANSEGHSRTQEKRVANWLYMTIVIAVILAAIAFMMLGRSVPMKPTNLDHTSTSSDATKTQQSTEQLNQTK